MKKLLLLSTLIIFTACKKDQNISDTRIIQDSVAVSRDSLAISPVENSNELQLESFGFPPEVSGCSCYFSATKEDFENEKFIYIDDYGNNAYIKIGGNMIKIEMKEGDFDPENFSKIIKNDDFTITISGRKLKEQPEVMLFQGTMTVENKNGEKTTSPIYGECGC